MSPFFKSTLNYILLVVLIGNKALKDNRYIDYLACCFEIIWFYDINTRYQNLIAIKVNSVGVEVRIPTFRRLRAFWAG